MNPLGATDRVSTWEKKSVGAGHELGLWSDS